MFTLTNFCMQTASANILLQPEWSIKNGWGGEGWGGKRECKMTAYVTVSRQTWKHMLRKCLETDALFLSIFSMAVPIYIVIITLSCYWIKSGSFWEIFIFGMLLIAYSRRFWKLYTPFFSIYGAFFVLACHNFLVDSSSKRIIFKLFLNTYLII